MDEVTMYKSTVGSAVYKVSPGYTTNESIRGIIEGTLVTGLYGNLIKADPDQLLSVISATSGEVLADDAAPANGDTLVVVSADAENTSKYILGVTAEGLSSDAVLVSDDWTITIDGDSGVISGFEPTITFKEFMDSIDAPLGATVIPTYPDGKYVPYKMLNYDTTYSNVMVSDNITILVTADNGVDQITYTIEPNAAETDAFVTSSVFGIDQNLSIIYLIPDGIPVSTFLSYLIPCTGAEIELRDKFGFLREVGNIISDDSLYVTAADGVTIRKYSLKMLGSLSASDIAYVISEVYIVDQDAMMISGENITTDVSVADFKANLIASTGATIAITNAAGQPKNSGNLAIGDLVKVISSNGTIVTYEIDVLTAIDNRSQDDLLVFPNPGKGLYTISGVRTGCRIQVTNIIGVKVAEQTATADRVTLSIEREKNGVYFITVIDNNSVVGRYKIVKE
jgi:hypothetical protein